MKTFVVNEKTYTAKPFTYNSVCDLEEMGVPLEKMQTRPMSFVRAYVAICGDTSLEVAGAEVENHMINGGELTDVMEIISEEMEKSDFFRAMSERTTNDPATRTQTPSKTKK